MKKQRIIYYLVADVGKLGTGGPNLYSIQYLDHDVAISYFLQSSIVQ
jgi:hypothetical protein